MTDTQLAKTLKLSALEAQRDAKRQKLGELFDENVALKRKVEAVQNQMKSLERDLLQMDDDIMELQEQTLESASQNDDDTNNNVSYEEGELSAVPPEEVLTEQQDNITLTMHPDEHLTEPTQQQQHDYRDDDDEAAAVEDFYQDDDNDIVARASRPSSSNSISSGVGQLELARGSSLTLARNNRQQQQQQQQVQHAATPAGLLPTKSPTLDDYFRPNRAAAAAPMPPSAANNSNNSFPWTAQLYDLLQNTFRIPSFRGHQEEIINTTLSQQDAFVIMRTGGGKSLTYQLPALLEGRGPQRKVTFVVSPLISLISDQEQQMNDYCRGSAISFSAGLAGGNAEHARRWHQVQDRNAGVCLVFFTPERLEKSNKLKSEMEKLQQQNRLGRFVIDECHCASQDGHSYRPDYAKLGILKRHFPNIPILATTATASERVRQDVCKILHLGSSCRYFRSTALRPNLVYSVRPKPDGSKDKLVDEMALFIKEKHPRGAGIVYTFSKKEADGVAKMLKERGIQAQPYHSDVSAAAKERTHKSWMRDKTQVVVATIAFGLGINKPDVRFVLHHSISKTLEAYYQESGRAGRDGKPADCVLFYSPKDVCRMLQMIHGENAEGIFWHMARYGQANGNDEVCKSIIMTKLNEPGVEEPTIVLERNDGNTTDNRDVGVHAQNVTLLLRSKCFRGKDLTAPMLVKEWRSKEPELECIRNHPPGKDLTTEECERIIICLLIEEVIAPKMVFSKFSTVLYLRLGRLGQQLCDSPAPKVFVRFPKKKPKTKASTSAKARKSLPKEDGWLDTKPKAKRKGAPSLTKGKAAKKQKKKSGTNKKAAAAKNKPGSRKFKAAAEVIELSSDDESDDEPIASVLGLARKTPVVDSDSDSLDALMDSKPRATKKAASPLVKVKKTKDIWDDDSDPEFDE